MFDLRHWGLRLLALPAALALAGVASPAAGPSAEGIAPGVSVGGLRVGGSTSEDARRLVRRAFSQPIAFFLDRETWTVEREELGTYPATDAAVAAALRAQPGERVGVSTAIVEDALDAYVRKLDKQLSRPVRNARFDGVDEQLRPVVVRERDGRRLDRPATRTAILEVLASPLKAPVRPVFRSMQPTVTRADLPPMVVIQRESKRLLLYERGKLVRAFAVATGTWTYPTPLGEFTIVDMQRHPAWYPPNSEWARGLKPIPPGPGNPLGTRWMGLDVYGVGIHGTPNAASIGYSASHGCIRMHISEAEWLFQRVEIGTPVVIVSA